MAKSIAPIVLAIIIGGCCACGTSSTNTSTTEPATSGPQPYVIIIGSGGGVMGNVSGLRIDTTGEIMTWESYPKMDFEPEYFGHMPQDRLTGLYTIIEEDTLMRFNHAETGNMTAFLTFQGGGEQHRIRWAGIETDTAAAPIPLRRFITAMNKAYKTIKKPE